MRFILGIVIFIFSGFALFILMIRSIIRSLFGFKRKNPEPNKGFGGFGNFSDFNKNAGGSGFGGNRPNNNESKKNREGEVKIITAGDDNRKLKDKVGEYVDFDEVKE